MDWQLLGLSFITVFLAEIGDKSQLAAIALGGSQKSTRAVFLGSVTALLIATFIGVLAGGGVAHLFPTRILKAIAAIGFAMMAVRLLWHSPVEDCTTDLAADLAADLVTDVTDVTNNFTNNQQPTTNN